MDFDAYMPCPGGKGKKLRFCCRDLLKDLEKLWRMIEGEQYRAALQHVDQLRARTEFADRACLLAMRAELLWELGLPEEAQANAEQFVEKHPDSPVAWAEHALVRVFHQDVSAAVDAVHEALERLDGAVDARLLAAMHQLARLLLYQGHRHGARSMWLACADVTARQGLAEAHQAFFGNVRALDQASGVPLLMKTGFRWRDCPDDAPWKARFEEAMAPLGRHCWRLAARRLAELTQEVPDSPAVWHNLARLRAWLADTEGAIEALRRQADCEESLEDAVEAETLAMLLEEDPLGDLLEECSITWMVREPEPVHEALLSDPQVQMVPVSEDMRPEDGSSPPKLAAVLLDRPIAESAGESTLEDLPVVAASLALFGRQTDRAARLELSEVRSDELDRVVELVRRLGGEHLEADFERETTQQLPRVAALLETRWVSPREASPEQMERLVDEYRHRVLFDEWPQTPLGLFDGRSPQEAAGDPDCRRRLLAAILLLDQWAQSGAGRLDFNELRSRLGLPTLEPIDPAPGQLKSLPAVRLGRVRTEGLSDTDLATAYHRAVAARSPWLIRRFAQLIARRPDFADVPAKVTAWLHLASGADSYEEATGYLDQVTEFIKGVGGSTGQADMLRLRLALRFGESEEAIRLIEYVRREHRDDQVVMQELFRTLVQLGLIRPDGSAPEPAAAPPDSASQQAQAAGPAKLWTPGSDQGGAQPGGSSGGIWTPD